MKWKYFKWSPVGTIVLVLTFGLFVWYLIDAMRGGSLNVSGYLVIVILFITRGIMWTGWDKEEIIRLNDEIKFLKSQINGTDNA